MMVGINWMMKAMKRVKMSSEELPSLEVPLSLEATRPSAENK